MSHINEHTLEVAKKTKEFTPNRITVFAFGEDGAIKE